MRKARAGDAGPVRPMKSPIFQKKKLHGIKVAGFRRRGTVAESPRREWQSGSMRMPTSSI